MQENSRKGTIQRRDSRQKKMDWLQDVQLFALKEQKLQLDELRFLERKACGIRVEDGGWHFGYMGGHGERM